MQSSFMDQLHKQEFTLLLAGAPLNVMQTHLHSYVGLVTGAWLLARVSTPSFRLSFAHFFIALYIHLNILHPIILHLSRCQCGHTIDDLSIHLLHFPYGNKHTSTHDTLWNIVVTIASKSGAHVQREVSHLFPCHTQRRVAIVITRINFHTLANIIPTCTNLVQCVLMMTTHTTIIATQDKARPYIKRTPREDFIPLATKTYDCLHPHFDSFLTSCVHACIIHHQ
jgi:hypothetical protein